MSLINNALKKAQRQHSGDGCSLFTPGGGSQARGGGSKSGQNLMFVLIGGAVLVAVSVGITIYLVRSPASEPTTVLSRQSSQSDRGATAQVSTVPPVETDSSRPSSQSDGGATAQLSTVPPPTNLQAPIVAETSPVVTLPTVVPPASSPQPVRQSSQSDGGSTVAQQPSTVAPSTAPAPVPSNAIYAFIDQLQVMGVRSSGTDSKVLMNDRVYRVNDFVNRELGLKLTKVNSDSLTFVDANGASYTKQF